MRQSAASHKRCNQGEACQGHCDATLSPLLSARKGANIQYEAAFLLLLAGNSQVCFPCDALRFESRFIQLDRADRSGGDKKGTGTDASSSRICDSCLKDVSFSGFSILGCKGTGVLSIKYLHYTHEAAGSVEGKTAQFLLYLFRDGGGAQRAHGPHWLVHL